MDNGKNIRKALLTVAAFNLAVAFALAASAINSGEKNRAIENVYEQGLSGKEAFSQLVDAGFSKAQAAKYDQCFELIAPANEDLKRVKQDSTTQDIKKCLYTL